MAGIWSSLFGGKPKTHKVSTLTPQQQNLSNQLYSGLTGGQSNIPGLNYIQQLLSDNPEAFASYEAPALRQFNQQIVPGIAEQFSGMGMGAQGSSAFQQQLASAAGRLSQDLAAQRANLRQGAFSQLQGLYGQAMQPQFQSFVQPQYGAISPLLGAFGGGLGYGAGSSYGSGIYNNLFGGLS